MARRAGKKTQAGKISPIEPSGFLANFRRDIGSQAPKGPPQYTMSGICRGGPLSGKPLHHAGGPYAVFKREGKLVSYTMPAGGPSELPKGMEVGWYVFDGDLWQWTRDDPRSAPATD